MITIVYIQCISEFKEGLCHYLINSCNSIELCLYIHDFMASWQELVLAFTNVLNAIKNGKNIARKIELEFYIRFFVERQIHIVLNHHLTRLRQDLHVLEKLDDVRSKYGILLMSHDKNMSQCISSVLNNFMKHGICRYVAKPRVENMQKLYIDFIEKHGFGGISISTNLNSAEIQKLVLAVIGCGNILLKD